MTPEILDLSGLEAQLAGLGPAVRTAAPGPALRGAAQAVAAAVRAVQDAPTGGDPDADWIATRGGDRLTVFGPDLVVQATFDGSAVVSARAVADERALQCDYGDPTARADPDPTRLLEAGLGGIADRIRGAALGKLGVTMGGIRVRLAEGGQTLGDWMFDDAGTGEPVEEVAAREMDEAAQRLEQDFGRADEPENMAPRTDAGSLAGSVTRGTGGGGAGVAGAATAGVSAAVAAAASRALIRKARQKQAERRADDSDVPATADDAPDAVAEQAAPAPATSQDTAFVPTHAVAADGLVARDHADAAAPVVARLAPGLRLRVVQEWGAWARVEAANGWSGWVDGRRLIALS